MALTFDTRKAFQKLLQRGLPESAADGIVEVVEEATNTVVTTEILRAELAEIRTEFAQFRADMWRALYTAVGAIAGVVIAVAAVSLTIAGLIT